MAFKTHSGSSFFSLDGVPFTVSEKWKAPKKVVLPMKFETGNPSEFLFLEYDSTLEEALLARFEAERENEKAAAAAAAVARARISVNSSDEGSVNAGGSLAPTENSARALSHVKFETKVVGQPESTNRNAAYLASRTNENNSDQRSLSRNAAYHMNGNILVPTPIAAPGECVLPGTSRVTNNFDLTDFENVQDPFENLSLKVMNDFEELDKVFLASSRLQSEAVSISKQDNEVSDGVSSELLPHSLRGDGAHQNREVVSRDCGNASSSLLEKVDESHQMLTGRSAPEPFLFPSASYAAGYLDSPSSKANSSNRSDLPLSNPAPRSQNSSESKIPHSILAGNLASSVLSSKHNIQSAGNSYDINRDVIPQNIMTSSSPHTDLAGGYAAYGGVTPASLWPTSATSGAAWPTATSNFNNRPLHDLTKGHLVHHNFEQFNITKDSLRSAKSNPDLSAVDENPSNPFVSFGRHTPPIDTRGHLPERFSINVAQNRSKASLTTGSTAVAKSTVATENMKPFSHEDGLYSTLSDEAQQFVDFIVAMGFPKLQTIRAVQKLGIDEKLVLDHLCSFSKLTENGYSEKDVEKSLFLFEGDLEKAKSYIASTMTFRAMGFEEDRISKALVECGLDEEKSLDWLTS